MFTTIYQPSTEDSTAKIRTIKIILRIVLVISIILFIVAYFQHDNLPAREHIHKELHQEPIQTATDRAPFQVERGGTFYTITPLYDYELYGLVVSCHDSQSWFDYYHKNWGDAINIKDICVIWGINVRTEVYKTAEYSSGPYTCYVQYRPGLFDVYSLSNNHLLYADDHTYNEIKATSTGDQIYLKGYLVNYSTEEGFYRTTSTTRQDSDCEIIYVTDYQILDKANAVWHSTYTATKYIITGCLILLIILFFKSPQKRYL